jgi:hypothetical protein
MKNTKLFHGNDILMELSNHWCMIHTFKFRNLALLFINYRLLLFCKYAILFINLHLLVAIRILVAYGE